MRVYHATPRKNLKSILKRGLLTSKSRGKRAVIWLHSDDNWTWAISHVAKRHGVSESDVVLLCIDIDHRYLIEPLYRGISRAHMRGVYTVDYDLSPLCIEVQSELAGRVYRSMSDGD